MVRSTGRTITDLSVLEKQLQTIRDQGYVYISDECIEGMSFLARYATAKAKW